MRLVHALLVAVVALVIVVWFVSNVQEAEAPEPPDPEPSPQIETEGPDEISGYEEEITQGHTEVSSQVKELVESIYDYGLDYQMRAVKAVDDIIQHHDVSLYVRWRPVKIDAKSILLGDYSEDGALPEVISITPFPDAEFVADQQEYLIVRDGAIWTGSVRGTNSGRVEITVVGDAAQPGMSIRILDPPRQFRLIPTESPDIYVAIEVNPLVPKSDTG